MVCTCISTRIHTENKTTKNDALANIVRDDIHLLYAHFLLKMKHRQGLYYVRRLERGGPAEQSGKVK